MPSGGHFLVDTQELHIHGPQPCPRLGIKAVAGTQFGVGRAYNRLVKRHFDAAGIEIPFPHMTLYFGEDKQGKAPPANLRLLDGREDAPGDPA